MLISTPIHQLVRCLLISSISETTADNIEHRALLQTCRVVITLTVMIDLNATAVPRSRWCACAAVVAAIECMHRKTVMCTTFCLCVCASTTAVLHIGTNARYSKQALGCCCSRAVLTVHWCAYAIV
jgi:hypothetical protein